MDSADLSRDTSGTRSFSQFVVELADRQPSLVLPNISLLLCHLDGDVSSLQLCVSFFLFYPKIQFASIVASLSLGEGTTQGQLQVALKGL